MAIRVSICILTYNRCSTLSVLLKDLCLLLDDAIEIIVVDNHSSDNTPDVIPVEFTKLRYFRTDKNIGAAGRNIAFANARGRIIICLDDDVFGLTSETVWNLYEKFVSNPQLGAVNFKVVDAFTGDLCNWVHRCMAEQFADKEFMTYEITEGAVAFRKEALDRSGYYDDIYFISHEGPDLAFRIMREGYDCIYWGDVVVRHCHENSGRVSWLNYYYDTRNQIYLAVKNFPFGYAMIRLTVGLISMLIYSLRDGFSRYWFKAVTDGIRNCPAVWQKRNVLPADVMRRLREINKHRAPLLYKIRLRLFRKDARL